MMIKIPIVIGLNRLRGSAQGPLVADDFDQDNLARLRDLLRGAAVAAGLGPTIAWVTRAVRQILDMYAEAFAEWQKRKDGTIGFVIEAAFPGGELLLLGDPIILARLR